jgi:hypothetical protein
MTAAGPTRRTPMPELRRVNRGRGHSYTVDGRAIPGVTTLIGDGCPKPALVSWAARTVAEYVANNLDDLHERHLGRDSLIGMLRGVPYSDRDAAANRGTQVHDLAQRLARGEEIDVPDDLVGHIDAYLALAKDWQPADELAERPRLNVTRWYAGTFDLVATLKGRGRVLLDTKTSRSGVYPETALQLAAYRNSELYETDDGALKVMPVITETLALWLRADGYDLLPIDTGPEVFRSFLYVADTAQRFIGARRESFIGPPLEVSR